MDIRGGRAVTWRDGPGRLTVGFSSFAGGLSWPSFGVSACTPEVPDGHHDPVRCSRPGRARVHQHGTAGISRVPRWLQRAHPPGLRAGLAAVRRLVPAASAPPVPGPPRGHRVLRPRSGSPRPRPATITRRLCTVAGFYRYAVEEELLDHSPAAHVRRARLDYESHAAGLDRNELGALRVAAGLGPPAEHALISLLALNGLRVSEAANADIEALGIERGHRTLVITRKGGKVVTIPLAPRTARAIDLAIGERMEGLIFLAADGRRLDRHGAGRIARQAGITKKVGPHTLRHVFITAALDAGVPLRDVQEAASHADPRATMRYDRARTSLDRHATYIVAAYVAGAAR